MIYESLFEQSLVWLLAFLMWCLGRASRSTELAQLEGTLRRTEARAREERDECSRLTTEALKRSADEVERMALLKAGYGPQVTEQTRVTVPSDVPSARETEQDREEGILKGINRLKEEYRNAGLELSDQEARLQVTHMLEHGVLPASFAI